jgi:hypothetical protein
MNKPTPVNAECYITARMSMQQLYDFERDKARVAERHPNWVERGVMYAWQRVGDPVMEGTLRPQDWFELGMMFSLHEQGKL